MTTKTKRNAWGVWVGHEATGTGKKKERCGRTWPMWNSQGWWKTRKRGAPHVSGTAGRPCEAVASGGHGGRRWGPRVAPAALRGSPRPAARPPRRGEGWGVGAQSSWSSSKRDSARGRPRGTHRSHSPPDPFGRRWKASPPSRFAGLQGGKGVQIPNSGKEYHGKRK